VIISDYKFTPATLTIHVGDTVTWTNDGPMEHSATSNSGAFNTGLLKKGQSASHTFTQAGTFAYDCVIHPFMHGTIIVLAATTTTAPAASSPTSPTTPTPTAGAAQTSAGTTSSGPTLPVTGLSVLALAIAGAILLFLGLPLRRFGR
jgi:hypothetical protein